MQKKTSPKLTPEAARILEQYRNAGKTPSGEGGSAGPEGEDHPSAPKPTPPPNASRIQRTGNRGK